MASVQDVKTEVNNVIAEAFLTLLSLEMLYNDFDITENKALWLSCIKTRGACISHDDWMNCGAVLCLYCCMCKGQNIAEYEAYYHMSFTLTHEMQVVRSSFKTVCTN